MKDRAERRRRSARETFGNCRVRYAAEYLDGVDNGGDAARRGTMFHRFRELYVRALFKARVSQDHELALAALEQARIEQPLPWAEWLDVEQMATRWMPWYALDVDAFVSTEGAIPGFAQTLLRLDEVTMPASDTLQIKDCKTHWRVPNDADLRASFQTQFYLAGLRRIMPGFDHYQMQYEHARYTLLSEVIELSPAELDAVDAAIAEQDVAMDAAEAQIKHAPHGIDWPYEAFPATGGSHCRTCMAVCPLVEHAKREPVRVLDSMDAAVAVGTIEAMRRSIALRMDALRAYTDAQGPYEAGGIRYQHWPVESASYDAREVLRVLHEADIDLAKLPKGVLTISGSAVEPLVTSKKKWKGIEDAIKAVGKLETFTKFGGKRVKAEDDDPQATEQ